MHLVTRHPGQAAKPRDPGSIVAPVRWTPALASLGRGDDDQYGGTFLFASTRLIAERYIPSFFMKLRS